VALLSLHCGSLALPLLMVGLQSLLSSVFMPKLQDAAGLLNFERYNAGVRGTETTLCTTGREMLRESQE